MNKTIEILKQMNNPKFWVERSSWASEKAALESINLLSGSSGWFSPKPVKIEGYEGYFTKDQEGGIDIGSRYEYKNGQYIVFILNSEGYQEFDCLWRNIKQVE